MEKYMIAVPCLDSMPTQFVAALTGLRRVGAVKHSFLSNSLVYDARNMLAKEALETGADRILWLDSDMYFKPDLMERMADALDSGIDFVCGIFFKRRFPTMPCIYKSLTHDDGQHIELMGEHYTDYPQDALFPIAGCGFGTVMMSTEMLADVAEHYPEPFTPMPGIFGEDLSFCWRAGQLGHKLWCDSRIKVGHVGQFVYSEEHWLAQSQK